MEYNPAPTAQPLPFLQAMGKAITGPNTANFRALAQNPNATAGQGFLWLAIASAIGTLISSVLFAIFSNNPLQTGVIQEYLKQYGGIDIPYTYSPGATPFGFLTSLICGVPLGAILAVVGTAIAAGLIHLVAGLLGGHGSYGKMVYMLALIQVPLGLVTSVLAPIPYLGCISAIISLYILVLQVLAIDGVYLFGTGKALLTLLIPLVVICLLLACVAVGIISLITIAASNASQSMLPGFFYL